MKLRITQPGFESYSGQMGMILFENGISVYDVQERDALRLSALFGCEWEDKSNVTITRVEVEPSAPVGRETFIAQTDGKPERVGGNDGETVFYEQTVADGDIPVKVTNRYTRAQLERIADKNGIAGIRDVAGPLGIRGTSINGLIEEILAVAGENEKLPEGVEVVEG